jgi:hypothetical protein
LDLFKCSVTARPIAADGSLLPPQARLAAEGRHRGRKLEYMQKLKFGSNEVYANAKTCAAVCGLPVLCPAFAAFATNEKICYRNQFHFRALPSDYLVPDTVTQANTK